MGQPVPAVAGTAPVMTLTAVGGVILGEPLAVSIDFEGNILVADGVPGRVVRIDASGRQALEFQRPTQSPGFHPSDLKLSGFFIYALDEVGRVLQRFDIDGAYRDQLVNFDQAFEGEISPVGLDVDKSGRIAVTDIRNHQIIVFNSFLDVELVFGSYGTFPGQFDTPQGVSFTDHGELLVADTGNRRIQRLRADGSFVASTTTASARRPARAPRASRSWHAFWPNRRGSIASPAKTRGRSKSPSRPQSNQGNRASSKNKEQPRRVP